MTDRIFTTRRRPAHHPPIERFNEPVIVLVTVCTKGRIPVLACDAVHRICIEIWQGADFWRVGRYVIMPDHIHLFCAPGRIPMPNLRQWVEFWKSQIARRVSLISGGPTSASAVPENPDGAEAVPPENRSLDGVEPVPPDGGMRIRGGSAFTRAGSGAKPDDTEVVPSGSRKPVKLWQRDFWDTQIRSRTHYDEKWSYVRMNPVRQGLAQIPDEWLFQGEVFPLVWR